MKMETKIRIYRCAVILLLLWDVWVTGYILSHPYKEEYVPETSTYEIDDITIEGDTVIFGGNSTAPSNPEYGETLEDSFYGFTEQEIDLMAACVYYEAGNQSMTGKRLVVDVILNRVRSGRFPDTILEVLSQDGQFTTWKKIKNSNPEDIPIDCYGAVLAEIGNMELSYDVFFFSSEGWNSSVHVVIEDDHYFGGIK